MNSTALRVFALTWLSYATYYLGRKNVAVSKAALEEQLHLAPEQLGAIDTGYLAAYAVGQFAMGLLADRLGSRRVVGGGMLLVALCVGACAASGSLWPLLLGYGLNGLFQASGWPGNVKAMTPQLAPAVRGRVMGLWSTCYQLGGLFAGWWCARLQAHHGWRAAFWVPALAVAAVGALVLLGLPEAPVQAAQARPAQRALLRRPGLWLLGAAYFCLKLVRYSLLFWLPYYLEKGLGYGREQAGYQSLYFEAGGAVGSVLVGLASDRYLRGRRALAGTLGCLTLAGALLLYTRVGEAGAWANAAALALVGASLFGPDALVSAAAAQDLGGAEASATAAGFINGMGSVGAVLQGLFTARIAKAYGWGALFSGFVGMAVVAAAALAASVAADRREPAR